MENTNVTRKDGSSITFVMADIVSRYQDVITDFKGVFDDEVLKPLFDVLFTKTDKIFLLDSSANEEYAALKADGLKCENKKTFDSVANNMTNTDRTLDAQQGENFVGFSQGYLDANPTPDGFFATLIHELVHVIDQMITCNSYILCKPGAKDVNILTDNIMEFIKIADSGKSLPCFKEVNTTEMQKYEYERLTYCVQAYVSALLLGDPMLNKISILLRPIIEVCDRCIKKLP